MPDCPYCPQCFQKGSLSNTFAVVGRGFFKCGTCKSLHNRASFSDADLNWRINPQEWIRRAQENRNKLSA